LFIIIFVHLLRTDSNQKVDLSGDHVTLLLFSFVLVCLSCGRQ